MESLGLPPGEMAEKLRTQRITDPMELLADPDHPRKLTEEAALSAMTATNEDVHVDDRLMERGSFVSMGPSIVDLPFDAEDEDPCNIGKVIPNPIVWLRLHTGFRIIDLKPNHLRDAFTLLNAHFAGEEPLCVAAGLQSDSESLGVLETIVNFWAREGCSLCAVREGTGQVVGVLLARITRSIERVNTLACIKPRCESFMCGEASRKLLTFRANLRRRYMLMDHDMFMHICALCVIPKYRGMGVATELMRSCRRMSAKIYVPAVMGIFTSKATQTAATSGGLKRVFEVRYEDYKQNDEVPFFTPETSAIVMATDIPLPEGWEKFHEPPEKPADGEGGAEKSAADDSAKGKKSKKKKKKGEGKEKDGKEDKGEKEGKKGSKKGEKEGKKSKKGKKEKKKK